MYMMFQGKSPFFAFFFWLLLTLLSSVAHDVLPNSVVEGTNITLRCEAVSNISLVTWFGPDGSGKRIKYTEQGQTTILDSVPQRDRLTVEATNQSNLNISHIMDSDSGIYACNDGNVDLLKFSLDVKVPPINVSITNNREVTAGRDTLTLTCTTRTSGPIAEIIWRNGTDAPNGQVSTTMEQPGAHGWKIQYQNLTITPTRYMDGNNITCSAHNSNTTGLSVSDSVILSVMYNPLALISNGSTMSVKEGDTNLTLVCIAESKPVSSFIWLWNNVTLYTTGPKSDNQDILTIREVNRRFNGVYSCIANNSISPTGQGYISLAVTHPPDIKLSASNVTTSDLQARLVCMPDGIPNRYTFSTWLHLWPGYNKTLRSLPSTYVNEHNATLDLNSISYQDSGIYVCQASNGVKANGTQKDVITQMVYILVKAPPVILKFPKEIRGDIGGFVVIQLDYYSNNDVGHVTLQHSYSNIVKGTESVYEIEINNLEVQLHYVPAKVFQANFNISIDEEGDFGIYTVNVSNSIGFTISTLEIMHKRWAEPTNPGLPIMTIVGGSGGGVVVVLALLILVLTLLLRRQTSSYGQSTSRVDIQRQQREGGLVDNPVYESSGLLPGPSAGSAGAEYAVIVKPKKTARQLDDDSNLYTKVDKKNRKEMKGVIYTNDDLTRKPTNPDNVYENPVLGGVQDSGENVYENPAAEKLIQPQVNIEGLLYSDLELYSPANKKSKLIIRGTENGTEYVKIAYGKKGEPLPDSDDETQIAYGKKGESLPDSDDETQIAYGKTGEPFPDSDGETENC